MRILVIDEEIPYPLNSGKRLRTYNLLKHLADRHEIVFVCRRHQGDNPADPKALEDVGIQTIEVPHLIRKKAGPRFYTALLANLISKYPYSVSSHYSKKMTRTLAQIMNKSPFDLIHCEWTPYAVNLRPLSPVPSVVVAHNVEATIWRRYLEVERDPFKKTYIYFQWKKMKRFERYTFSRFTRSIAVSNQDRAAIARWVGEDKTDVVENGVDVDYFRPSNDTQKPYSMVFTGAMDWRPNADCMLYFLDEIWPLVLQSFPQSSLTIVGRKPMQILQDRVAGIPSVRLTGTVDDIRPFITKSSVFIVPLRVGGGSRLKILEALSMRKPVVSTTIGAEGLEVVPERDLLIADAPKEFASAIRRLFEDAPMRERLGSAGRNLVENRYQWKVLAEKLERVWLKASNYSGSRQ